MKEIIISLISSGTVKYFLTLVFLIFLTLYFNKPIKKTLANISRIFFKFKNNESELNLNFNSSIPDGSSDKDAKYFDLLRVYQSSVLTEEEKIIESQISSFSQSEAIKILCRHLAQIKINFFFTVTEKFISEYEIELLRYLNRNQSVRVNINQMIDSLRVMNMNISEEKLKNSLNAMVHWKLISVSNTLFKIDFLGKDFLKFLIEVGK